MDAHPPHPFSQSGCICAHNRGCICAHTVGLCARGHPLVMYISIMQTRRNAHLTSRVLDDP